MSALQAFIPASSANLFLLEGLLNALPANRHFELFSQTLSLVDMSGRSLGFEMEILEAALAESGPGSIERALSLYNRPGRLFYETAHHTDELMRRLGIEIPFPEDGVPESEADLIAQSAWARIGEGAAEMLDRGVFYDPVGAMSGGILYYLDRQGIQAHDLKKSEEGHEWMPPPAFGVLSRETPERLRRYNQGENDQVGNVAFDFQSDLQMVVVPKAYEGLLRRAQKLQFLIPASDMLESSFTVEKALELPDGVCIVTSIKGLCGGKTPLEHFDNVLKEAGRTIPVVDFLGYASAAKVMKEQRERLAGRGGRGDLLDIVLCDPYTINALELAKRWAGPEAVVRQEVYNGIPIVIVENLNLNPPLRFTIVSDRDVIRANEKVSIDKNLQAIRLGGDLFGTMIDSVLEGQMGDPLLYKEFAAFYEKRMEQAEVDMIDALDVEHPPIPPNKRVILPGVRKDFYGSWTTTGFEPLYRLVQAIFNPTAKKGDWQEAMVLLKLRIGDYFSVRNPQYGFCAALDRAAVMHDRWLSREDVEATVVRLREKGLLVDRDGRVFSDDVLIRKLALGQANDAHFFFSTIPEGLLPEGFGIAEQLPVRYGRRMRLLPKSYHDAHLLVQRLQHSVFFAPEIYQQVVALTRDMAFVFPGSPHATREAYLPFLETLTGHFQKGLGVLIASKHVFSRSRDVQTLLEQLLIRMRILLQSIRDNQALGPHEISLINQGVIEVLTVANLFYILPPKESETEAVHLLRRMKALIHFARRADAEILFPSRKGGEEGATFSGEHLTVMRRKIFNHVRDELIDLTYRMNVRLHAEDQAITKKDITDVLHQMINGMEGVLQKSGDSDPLAQGFLDVMNEILRSILRGGQAKKFNPHQRLLVYQALVECLIHTRRLVALPEELAGREISYTVKRFLKIQDFIQGKVASPLWFFGNGGSH